VEDFKFSCLSGCLLYKLYLMETKSQSKRATYVAEFELYKHFMISADSRGYENQQLQKAPFCHRRLLNVAPFINANL